MAADLSRHQKNNPNLWTPGQLGDTEHAAPDHLDMFYII
jgi:hypothetical protein